MRLLAILSLLSLPAAAQTVYSWEDAEGVHFTDDLSQVPKGAKNVQATLNSQAPRPAPAPAATPTPAPSAARAPAAAPARAEPQLDERAWRDRFVIANRRISTLQENIRALEASLPPRTECVAQPIVPVGTVPGNTQGAPITTTPGSQVITQNGVTTVVSSNRVGTLPARCQVNELHDRIKLQIAQEQVRLKDAQTDLDTLEREASYAGVPREWRRGW